MRKGKRVLVRGRRSCDEMREVFRYDDDDDEEEEDDRRMKNELCAHSEV